MGFFKAFIVTSFCLFHFALLGQQQSFYQNPVIPGDFPDPTIIRVGAIYYAAGTTSNFAPNYPLYESTDLINWKQIGAVFHELPKWTSGSFWAPELFYKNGTFFVYYTAKRKGDGVSCIGVATTKDIHKGFTDHGIIVEWGKEAIDAYVFEDGGTTYITWKAYGLTEGKEVEILASELSPDGLGMVGEHFTITDLDAGWEWETYGQEGQCIVKHGDYYYNIYSMGGCCDNRCNYYVKVARSKNLKSGWEQFPDPILQGGDRWKCTGHGTLVSTPDDRYYYLYHAYEINDFEYIGRQGMLDEVIWNEKTGWPEFKNGKTPSLKAPIPFKNTVQKKDSLYIDDFSSAEQLKRWQWDLTVSKPKIETADGVVSVSSTYDGISFLGLSPTSGDYSFETVLMKGERAGIGIYGSSNNVLALTKNSQGGTLFQIKDGKKEMLSRWPLSASDKLYLKVTAQQGRYYRFYWSYDKVRWMPIKLKESKFIDGMFLPYWGTAMRVGFIFEGKSQAEFSAIRITYPTNEF